MAQDEQGIESPLDGFTDDRHSLRPWNIDDKICKIQRAGFRLWDPDGQTMFALYGRDGGIKKEVIYYWWRGGRKLSPKEVIGLEVDFSDWGSIEEFTSALQRNVNTA